MGKMRGNQNAIIIIVSLMVGWSFHSVYQVIQKSDEQKSDSHLLYQVTLFQIEMLNNVLADSPHFKSPGELTPLKQAAYAVDYTHERFLIALGSNKAVELFSMKRLMDYILRLQMGGERSLKPDEIQVLVDAGLLFIQLHEEFAKLMANNHIEIIPSQNVKVHKVDQDLVKLFSRKLLQ
ncbi:MAG: hypothetical protein WD469_08090 [Paenibacillaceae bacterium]